MIDKLSTTLAQLRSCGSVEITAVVRGADEFATLAAFAGVEPRREVMSNGDALEQFGCVVEGVRVRVLHPVARALRAVR